MSFLLGISAIRQCPDLAPANKGKDHQEVAREARHVEILKVFDSHSRLSIKELAEELNQHVALMHSDVATLISKGELADKWECTRRYIRRSTLYSAENFAKLKD